ncbi:PLP-dependent cysteine synthase family protein [Desulfovibrio sp. UCD-KL4C]|uniref:PLP-dependent cysteine synthase family protein n=1 Tax=Desulfovibrio sp. UCD-KL4C TaxID=2578120 RepID=UPI0025C0FCE8|nr:cysteine synthase family protein [Desulfovibrio sp. UCD-KL4C]
MVLDNILECVGSTPCLRLKIDNGIVLAKAEFMNPSGSIKDRVAVRIIKLALKNGTLRPGMRIAEASSGNMGISLAMVGASCGCKVTIYMCETASVERRSILRMLGADLVLTPAHEGVGGAVEALRLDSISDPNVFLVNQFGNKENIAAHYNGTGKELWEDIDSHIDCFISGVGSGGTLMGVGAYLRERNPNVHLVAVEPKGAAALLGHKPKAHSIEGIGDGFLPEIVDPQFIDSVVEISDSEATDYALDLAREKGIFVGMSSGANLAAASSIMEKHPDWRVVTVLPDRAERYFSTQLFANQSVLARTAA